MKISVFTDISIVGFHEYIVIYWEISIEILRKNINGTKINENL